MADEIDLANDLIDNEVSRALRKIRQHVPQATQGSKFCVECGEAIPALRQKWGLILCKPCAEEAERRKLLFAE